MKKDISSVHDFQVKILIWYSSNKRDFYWRQDGLSQYNIIIAEALLQRTKAETVNNFYTFFMAKYPNWKSLDDAAVEKIERDLKPLGLHKQRANRLKKLATEMISLRGVIPSSREDLDKISMFGQYIANAVELQIFHRKKPLLDVNMARVLERYFGARKLSDIRYDPYLQELAHLIVDHSSSKEISWAILDFAAIICKSRKPMCSICFLANKCIYFNKI